MNEERFSKLKLLLIVIGLIGTLPLMMFLASSIGEVPISLKTTACAVTNSLGLTHYPLSTIEVGIVWQYRMSRALIAASSGGGLALCGLVLQSLLRNSLADPYLLGISAGASTGAVSIMLLGIGGGVITVGGGAFAGAIIAFLLISILSKGFRDNSARIILAGVAGTQLFNALTSYIVSIAANAEQSRGVMFWLLGSLSGVRWPEAIFCSLVTVFGLLVILYFSRSLDTFTFGTEVSMTLGTHVFAVRTFLFLVTALLTAVIVSTIGAVGFIGLVIPHITRMIIGNRHLVMLPVTFFVGCHFMIIADILSRTLISGQVLPIGVVTALVGAPIFAFILYRNRGRS